jgi:hypothetical protein
MTLSRSTAGDGVDRDHRRHQLKPHDVSSGILVAAAQHGVRERAIADYTGVIRSIPQTSTSVRSHAYWMDDLNYPSPISPSASVETLVRPAHISMGDAVPAGQFDRALDS